MKVFCAITNPENGWTAKDQAEKWKRALVMFRDNCKAKLEVSYNKIQAEILKIKKKVLKLFLGNLG